MHQNFEKCLTQILKYEGGYSNHPKDRGGATMRGVTQAVYNGYRKRIGKSPADVRGITDAELRAIYRQQYWDVIKGDELPIGVDLVVFDGAINSGAVQSAKWLQRALNDLGAKLDDDGHIGFLSLEAMDSESDHAGLVKLILDKRMAFLRGLDNWNTFKGGWTNRVNDVRQVALSMLGATPAPQRDPPQSTPATTQTSSSFVSLIAARWTAIFGGKKS